MANLESSIAPRYPLIAPASLSESQLPIHEHVSNVSKIAFGSHAPFSWRDNNGALIGPFTLLLYTPSLGTDFFDHAMAVTKSASLPSRVKELVILAVGGHFGSAYEIYAHSRVAILVGLSEQQVAQAVASEEPQDLTHAESSAYQFALAMVRSKGSVAEDSWRGVLEYFNQEEVAILIQLVSSYTYVSMILNACAVGIPREETT